MKLLDKLLSAVRSNKPTQADRVVRVEAQRKEARLELEQAITGLALARARNRTHEST